MDEEEIEKAVIAYLKKKGFKQTELAFQEEQQHQHPKNNTTDTDIAKQILSFSEYAFTIPFSFYKYVGVQFLCNSMIADCIV